MGLLGPRRSVRMRRGLHPLDGLGGHLKKGLVSTFPFSNHKAHGNSNGQSYLCYNRPCGGPRWGLLMELMELPGGE